MNQVLSFQVAGNERNMTCYLMKDKAIYSNEATAKGPLTSEVGGPRDKEER